MFGSAAIGIIVNLFIGFGLQKGDDNLNVRAATLHVFGDVAASMGVIIAGVIILLTGWTLVDPLLSVGIAVLIAVGAWRLVRETTDILLEAVPRGLSLPHLVDDMKNVEGIKDVHDLHVWCITNSMYALSCHALIDNLPPSASSSILQSLTTMLNEKYRIGHATIQFESYAHQDSWCSVDGLYCRMEAVKEKCHDHEREHADCSHEKDTRQSVVKRDK